MLNRRRMMMNQNDGLVLFEDGEFNPILGEIKKSGFWAIEAWRLPIKIENGEIVMSRGYGSNSWWGASPIDISAYKYLCVEWSNIYTYTGYLEQALAGFTNQIISNTSYETCYPADCRCINLSPKTEAGINKIEINESTIIDKHNCYFSVAVSGWNFNTAEWEHIYSIKKIWLE